MTASANAQEAKRWLAYAQQDMDVARELAALRKGYPHAICYHAQQAAEKAIKAGLIFAQIDFPLIHDLTVLKRLLPDDWQTRQNSINLNTLTSWATASRYPGTTPDPNEEDADRALQESAEVMACIRADLSQRGLMLI